MTLDLIISAPPHDVVHIKVDPLHQSTPIRAAWFTLSAAIVATFAMVGTWTVRMALADYRSGSRRCPAPKRQSAWNRQRRLLRRLAALTQDSDPAGSTAALSGRWR